MTANDSFSILGCHILGTIKCDNSTVFKLLHIDLPLCSRILDLCFTTRGRHHCFHFMDDKSEAQKGVTCPSSQGQCQEFTPGLPAPKLGFLNHSSVYIPQLGEDLGFHWASQSNQHILLSHCLLNPGLVCLLMPLPVADPAGPSRRLSVTTWDGLAEASGSNTVWFYSNQSHPEKGWKQCH